MIQDYSFQIKVPKERIAVIIGKGGKTKSEIEEATKTRISIFTDENLVIAKSDDALNLFGVQEVLKAIARGFNPQKALQLTKTDFVLQILELRDFVKKQHFERIKGRIIGQQGKARANIELLTDTYISVYGKTVCIIGRAENVNVCRRALTNLINGSPHSAVYKWLEKKRVELKTREILERNSEKW